MGGIVRAKTTFSAPFHSTPTALLAAKLSLIWSLTSFYSLLRPRGMTTFMERLPSLRRRDRDPPSTDHRRLGSAPPSPESELAPEADLTELRHDDSPQKKKRRSSSKGKGKEVDPRERGAQSPFEVELDHQEFAGQEQDGMTTDAGGVSSYPPTNEEELETKRIEEVRCFFTPLARETSLHAMDEGGSSR